MKSYFSIRAVAAGTVDRLCVAPGQLVGLGAELLIVKSANWRFSLGRKGSEQSLLSAKKATAL